MTEDKKQKIEQAARRMVRTKIALEDLRAQNLSHDSEVLENQIVQLAITEAELDEARKELVEAQETGHLLWCGTLAAGPDLPWYFESKTQRAFCKHEPILCPGMRYRREWPTIGEWHQSPNASPSATEAGR